MAKLTLSYPLSPSARKLLLLAGHNHGERQTIIVLSPNHEEPPAASPTDVAAALQDAATAVENGGAVADLLRGLAGIFGAATASTPDTTVELADEALWARVVALVLGANETDSLAVADYGTVGYEPDLHNARDRFKLRISERKGSYAFDRLITAAEFCTWFDTRIAALVASQADAVAAARAELEAAVLADARRSANGWLSISNAKELPAEAAAIQSALDNPEATVESVKAATDAFCLVSQALDKVHEEAARVRRAEVEKETHAAIAVWAKVHGSPYLKGLAAIGGPTEETYRKERLTLELPGWVLAREAEGSPYRPGDHGAPTPAQVENMLRARATQSEAALRSYYLPQGRTILPTVVLSWAPGCAAYLPLPTTTSLRE